MSAIIGFDNLKRLSELSAGDNKPVKEKYDFICAKNGQPLNDLRNYVIFVDGMIRGKIRYNELTHTYDLLGTTAWKRDTTVRSWGDADTYNLSCYACEYGLKSIPTLQNALHIVADRNRYNPLVDYLNGLNFKGDGYIRSLAPEYLGCEDTEYTYECMKLLLTAMVMRAYHPGCKYDIVTVFQGIQGAFKTSFCRFLARNDNWFSDSLDGVNDRKKAAELIQGKWLVEIAELSALRKSELEATKSFVTAQTDSYRQAYAHFPSDYPRLTVFVATTNEKQFLRDTTGSRRFNVLKVDPAHRTKDLFTSETRDNDFDAALAEAVHYVKETEAKGGVVNLTLPKSVADEAVKQQQLSSEYEEWQGIVETWLDGIVHAESPRYQTCALDVWCHCLNKDRGSYSVRESRRINAILNSLTDWEPSTGVRIRVWDEVKEKRFDYRGRGFQYINSTTKH